MKYLIFALLSLPLAAHQVVLNWVDALNPSGTTYNVYRAIGPCMGTPMFSAIATGITVLTYTDTSVSNAHDYCYQVTAVNTMDSPSESGPSNQAEADVPGASSLGGASSIGGHSVID